MTKRLNRADSRRIKKKFNKQRRKEEKKAKKDNSQYNTKESNKLCHAPQANDMILQTSQVELDRMKRNITNEISEKFRLAYAVAEFVSIAVAGEKYFYYAVHREIVEHVDDELFDYFCVYKFCKAVEKKICDNIHSIVEGALFGLDFDGYRVLEKIGNLTHEIFDGEIRSTSSDDICGENNYIARLFHSDLSLVFKISSNIDKVINNALNVAFDSLKVDDWGINALFGNFYEGMNMFNLDNESNDEENTKKETNEYPTETDKSEDY